MSTALISSTMIWKLFLIPIDYWAKDISTNSPGILKVKLMFGASILRNCQTLSFTLTRSWGLVFVRVFSSRRKTGSNWEGTSGSHRTGLCWKENETSRTAFPNPKKLPWHFMTLGFSRNQENERTGEHQPEHVVEIVGNVFQLGQGLLVSNSWKNTSVHFGRVSRGTMLQKGSGAERTRSDEINTFYIFQCDMSVFGLFRALLVGRRFASTQAVLLTSEGTPTQARRRRSETRRKNQTTG